MERIQFNTGRAYTEHGQRIVALIADGHLYFNDIDRGIDGMYQIQDWDEWFKLTPEQVMSIYDHNLYGYIPSGIKTFTDGKMVRIEDLLIYK